MVGGGGGGGGGRGWGGGLWLYVRSCRCSHRLLTCAGTHNRACMPDTGVRKTYLSGPSYYLLRYEHARFCVEVLIRPV